jgi:hypothetical protein
MSARVRSSSSVRSSSMDMPPRAIPGYSRWDSEDRGCRAYRGRSRGRW